MIDLDRELSYTAMKLRMARMSDREFAIYLNRLVSRSKEPKRAVETTKA